VKIQASVKRGNEEMQLSPAQITAIIFLLIASLALAWYAGGLIGVGTMKIVEKIVEGQPDKDCKECEEARKNHTPIPIEVPDDESH